MRSIVRRDKGESYDALLMRLAAPSGVMVETAIMAAEQLEAASAAVGGPPTLAVFAKFRCVRSS